MLYKVQDLHTPIAHVLVSKYYYWNMVDQRANKEGAFAFVRVINKGCVILSAAGHIDKIEVL